MDTLKGIQHSVAARKQFWAAYLLLFVAIMGPVIGVIWLVQRAILNERVVYEAQLADSRLGQLRTARMELEKGFNDQLRQANEYLQGRSPGGLLPHVVDLDLADAGTTVAMVSAPPGANEVAQAEAFLSSVREALVASDATDRAGVLRRLFDGLEDRTLRMSNGRSAVAMAALLVMDTLPQEVQEGILSSLFRTIAGDYDAYPMPSSQRRFFLRQVLSAGHDPKLARYLEAELWVEEWKMALLRSNQFPPPSGEHMIGEIGYVLNESGRAVLLYRRDEMGARLNRSLSDKVEGHQEIQVIPEVSASELSTSGVLTLPLSGILAPWSVVWVPDPDLEVGNHSFDRMIGYLGIGGIVLCLSTIAGITIVVLIRRQMNLAELKNDLVATVSHELKTPIASTRLLVETLLHDPNPSPDKTRDYLEHIARENKRLAHLIENFLSFSRMEKNKNNFDLEPTDPGVVARDVAGVFEHRFRTDQITFELSVQAALPSVLADREAIQTAVGNLLENAHKYAVTGKWIRLEVVDTGKGVCFEVHDRGPGIPKAEQRKIFKRFYQGNRKLTEHSGGVGLGLSIVSFIVEKHHGTLALESESGRGSTFRLTLPYA